VAGARAERVTAQSGTGRRTGSHGVRVGLWAGLALLAGLHHDSWLWSSPRLVLGLPASLAYHVAYCLVVAGWLALLVRYAWPRLPAGAEDGDERGGAGGAGAPVTRASVAPANRAR
jgi:hypothetical protein